MAPPCLPCRLGLLLLAALPLAPVPADFCSMGLTEWPQVFQNWEDFQLRLVDFGSAFETRDGRAIDLEHPVQTLQYRAPEVVMGIGSSLLTPAIDLWSVGVILSELALRAPLFQANSIEELLEVRREAGTFVRDVSTADAARGRAARVPNRPIAGAYSGDRHGIRSGRARDTTGAFDCPFLRFLPSGVCRPADRAATGYPRDQELGPEPARDVSIATGPTGWTESRSWAACAPDLIPSGL